MQTSPSNTDGTSTFASVVTPVTVLYLIIPSVLFSIGWLRLPFALLNVIILSIFMIMACRELGRGLKGWTRTLRSVHYDTKTILALGGTFCVIAVWVALSGTGGFGFQTHDYRASNALLKDLVLQSWPVVLSVDGLDGKLVYYLAYYLPAAALGKLFGWEFANVFLLFWTFVGALLALAWFIRVARIDLAKSPYRIPGIVILFCLAGGLDLFGSVYLTNDILKISNQNEWWAGYFQYSSNTTLLFWVPQQAIATWLITGMVVDAFHQPRDIKYFGVILFSGFLWSPLGMIGVIPFLILLFVRVVRSPERASLLDGRSLILNALSVLIGVAHFLYIASNQFKFPIGLAWTGLEDPGRLGKYLLAFWFLEFALLGLLIILFVFMGVFSSRGGSRSLLLNWQQRLKWNFRLDATHVQLYIVSLGFLFLLPMFRLGIYNDLAMRSSIASLFVFWAINAKVLIDSAARARMRQGLLYSLAFAVLLGGFFPAFNGIGESIRKYHFGPPELSSVSTSGEANPRDIVLQRMGDPETYFYRFIGK